MIAVALAELHTTGKCLSVTNPLERHLADFSRDLVAMLSSQSADAQLRCNFVSI